MAIRMMCGREKAGNPNVEIIIDYPGCEVGYVVHDPNCPNCPPELVEKAKKNNGFNHDAVKGYTQEGCLPRCHDREPLYMETTHVGVVLSTGEHNYHDDSDFYALIWDEDTQSVREVEYASTRGWTYPNGAWVDATDEVKAKADAYYEGIALRNWKLDNEKQAKFPTKGKVVKVVKGRKTPVGTTGDVIWSGEGRRYGYYGKTPYRVGIKAADGVVHWTDADNVEVLNWEQYLRPESNFYYSPRYATREVA
jgi:hypothetical protein